MPHPPFASAIPLNPSRRPQILKGRYMKPFRKKRKMKYLLSGTLRGKRININFFTNKKEAEDWKRKEKKDFEQQGITNVRIRKLN